MVPWIFNSHIRGNRSGGRGCRHDSAGRICSDDHLQLLHPRSISASFSAATVAGSRRHCSIPEKGGGAEGALRVGPWIALGSLIPSPRRQPGLLVFGSYKRAPVTLETFGENQPGVKEGEWFVYPLNGAGLLVLGSDRRAPITSGTFCENQLGEKKVYMIFFPLNGPGDDMPSLADLELQLKQLVTKLQEKLQSSFGRIGLRDGSSDILMVTKMTSLGCKFRVTEE